MLFRKILIVNNYDISKEQYLQRLEVKFEAEVVNLGAKKEQVEPELDRIVRRYGKVEVLHLAQSRRK